MSWWWTRHRLDWSPARQNAEEPQRGANQLYQEVEDARRRGARLRDGTRWRDPLFLTPFHPTAPKFIPPHPLPSVCHTDTPLWLLSPACASSSHMRCQRTQQHHLNRRTHLYASNHSGTCMLSAGHMAYHGLNLQKHWSFIFKPSDSISHRAKVNGYDAASVDSRFQVKQQSFNHSFKVHIIWMSYVKRMLLPLKANTCLFPSQLASSLIFIIEALQLPGIEATCRSASIKAFHLWRVISCNINSYVLVQTHFIAFVFSYVWARSGIVFCPFPPKLCRYLIFHGFSWVQTHRHCAPAPEVYDVNVPLLGLMTGSCQPTGPQCWWHLDAASAHLGALQILFLGVSLCMKYLIFCSLLGIKMLNWLLGILQKKKKDNRDDQIRLHLDSALNVTEQFTPVRRACGVILNQTWSILQPLCTSINDNIRCKGNSQPDNYRASSHALLILITALCAETQHLPFVDKGRWGRGANLATCQTCSIWLLVSACPWSWRAGCSLPVSEMHLAKLQWWRSQLPPVLPGFWATCDVMLNYMYVFVYFFSLSLPP